MLATLTLAAALLLIQVGAYVALTRYLRKRAAYKRRVAALVAPHHIVAPWARNRLGDN